MNAAHEDSLRFSVLGPLRAWFGDRELDLGSPQQRVVLAALLLRRGRLVTTDELIEALWGEDPPATAVSVLRTYVSRLRKTLKAGRSQGEAPRTIASTANGYLTHVPDEALDLAVFEQRVAEAKRLRAAGEESASVRLLHTALQGWQGTPLEGLRGAFVETERSRLAEERFCALESRLDAEVRLGRHRQAIEELRTLVGRHPLRERLCQLLMLALYRSGRQAEALACFVETRGTLVAELGIEPSPSLKDLYDSILAADVPPARASRSPEVEPARHTRPSPPGEEAVRPAQLPPDLGSFVGRDSELAQVHALLPDEAPPPAVVLATISGMAGIGKTTLAVRWAHQVADRFPDGQLFLNLRGFDATDSAMAPEEALRAFLTALGVPPRQVPPQLEAQASLYRSRLARRRMLILLDNARDIEQVRPLLPGSPGSLVVVTSRNRLAGLVASDGAHPVTLHQLTPEEGRDVLGHRLGAARLAAQPAAADEIVGHCARVPLALAVVAARAAANPGFPLGAIADELRESHGSLDAFVGSDLGTDVRAVFSWSYEALSRPAARVFRLLGLCTGSCVSAPAVAALAGLSDRETRALLAELCDAHLLMERLPGRFALHDLLRVYAVERVRADEAPQERDRAVERLLSWYLHTLDATGPLLTPQRRRVSLDPPPSGCRPLTFTARDQALEWCEAERANLVAAVHHASVSGRPDLAWRLNSALWGFLHLRNRLDSWRDASPAALDAARAAHARGGETRSSGVLALNTSIDGICP